MPRTQVLQPQVQCRRTYPACTRPPAGPWPKARGPGAMPKALALKPMPPAGGRLFFGREAWDGMSGHCRKVWSQGSGPCGAFPGLVLQARTQDKPQGMGAWHALCPAPFRTPPAAEHALWASSPGTVYPQIRPQAHSQVPPHVFSHVLVTRPCHTPLSHAHLHTSMRAFFLQSFQEFVHARF